MKKTWWKEGVVYQIYPRSFMDSNNDGVGDIKGVIEKLDYLKELGIDVIWLSPVYKSPNDDNGYDISDYEDIMDEFGTMKDFDELLNQAHQRNIKILMDLVVNHSSDEHKWFVESRKSKDNPYRDYYMWADPKDGKEPNNWGSFFSGSAWQYDESSKQYYLHLFTKKQPDLNWENENMRKDIYSMMKFWLDKGVDGFRMDVINFISKVPELPSINSEMPGYKWGGEYFFNGPKIHDYLKEMNEKVLSKYDVMTVGETPGVTPDEGVLYVGDDRKELNMLFQFELMDVDSGARGKWDVTPWKLVDFKNIMTKWQVELHNKGWNSLYLNNHDQPRMVSRFGNDVSFRIESAKMLGTMLHTLQGTPYIYQGEEIGMTNVKFDSIDEYKDIETLNFYNEAINDGAKHENLMNSIYIKSRDNARTPMQWSDEDNGGFTSGKPWIKVNPNYKEINVANSLNDENSIFNYYKKLIKLRKENLVLVYGEYVPLLEDNSEIYSYLRILEDERILVLLNFFDKETVFKLPEGITYENKELLISNYDVDINENLNSLNLKPYEARVYRLK